MIELLSTCLFDSADEIEALEAIQKRQKHLNVNEVLNLAEKIFRDYCALLTSKDLISPEESYQVIEMDDDAIRKNSSKKEKSMIKHHKNTFKSIIPYI